MRWKSRFVALLLLFSIFLSLTPTHAAIIEVEEGQPIAVIPNIQDVLKLEALRSYRTPLLVGTPSPDGKSQLFIVSGEYGLIDLDSGNVRLLSGGVGGAVPVAAFFGQPLTQAFIWVDNQTVAFLGIASILDETISLFRVNIATGAVSKNEVPNVANSTIPYQLSPNAKKIIYINLPPATTANLKILHTHEIRTSKFAVQKENPLTGEVRYEAETLKISAASLRFSVYDIDSKTQTPLATIPEGNYGFSFAWSPDSTKIAMRLDLYPNFNSVTALQDIVVQDALGRLAPSNNPFLNGNSLNIFDLSGSQVTGKTVFASEGNGDTFASMIWSPDSRTILAHMKAPSRIKGRQHPVYLLRKESSNLRFYNTDGRLLNTYRNPEIDAPSNTDPYNVTFVSNDEVLINTIRGTDKPVFYYNRVSGEFRKLPIPAGSVDDFTVDRANRRIVVRYTSILQPPELFGVTLEGNRSIQFTNINRNIKAANNIKVENVSFTLKNGQKRTGLVVLPADAAFPPRNIPLLMWQQGGPGVPMVNRYLSRPEDPYNSLPNFGFGLLMMPLAGREGYGAGFFNSLVDNDNYGKIDIDEAAEIMEQAIAQGWTSRSRAGVVGCSYGGYFAAQSVVRHPNTYAATNPQCSALDDFYEWQFGSTAALTFYSYGVTPFERPERYIEGSPLYGASKVKAATLIFHGTFDFLPIRAAYNFHDAVQANGAAVNMYAFSGDGHGLAIPDYSLIGAQLQLDWFRKYLR